MTNPPLVALITEALDAAGIPHMLVGSFGSAAFGMPRATQDIDIVIDPTPETLDRFVDSIDVGPAGRGRSRRAGRP